MTTKSANAANYLDNQGRSLTNPNCDFGELLNNLWADLDWTHWYGNVITIPSGTYSTATPIVWTGKIFLCYADGVTINWTGGNKTVLKIGADPNGNSWQNPGLYNRYGDTNNFGRIYLKGITFNNISGIDTNFCCTALRAQNITLGVYENLTFNGFGIGALQWSDEDPSKNQSYYSYFNNYRSCTFNDCTIGFCTDGDPQHHGIITDNNTTIEFTRYCVATISSGTLTRTSGDALPTSGNVSVVWDNQFGFRNDCAIDGSYHLTGGTGYTLPSGGTRVRITWVYGTRTGCHVTVDPFPGGGIKKLLGETQGVTLPDSSTPVTLNWTTGIRSYLLFDENGRVWGGYGNPLPPNGTFKVLWYDKNHPEAGLKTTNGVVMTDYVLDDKIDPSIVNYEHIIEMSWTGTFEKSNAYLFTDTGGNVQVKEGTGDTINTGGNWCEDRSTVVSWNGGSKTCTIRSVNYIPATIHIDSSGSGYAMPTDEYYVGANIWQTRTVTVPINNGIVTLPQNHMFINSMATNSSTNVTRANVTVSWNDGQARSRTGCTFSRIHLDAEIGGGSGDTLPTTGTVTLSQTRGLVQYRPNDYPSTATVYTLDYHAYNASTNPTGPNWTVTTSSWGSQSTCMRGSKITGNGDIDTLFDFGNGSNCHFKGVNFNPTNAGSYLIKGTGANSIKIEHLGNQANISWTGVDNLIDLYNSDDLNNLTIYDDSGI